MNATETIEAIADREYYAARIDALRPALAAQHRAWTTMSEADQDAPAGIVLGAQIAGLRAALHEAEGQYARCVVESWQDAERI